MDKPKYPNLIKKLNSMSLVRVANTDPLEQQSFFIKYKDGTIATDHGTLDYMDKTAKDKNVIFIQFSYLLSPK